MQIRQDGFSFYWVHPTTGKLVKLSIDNIQQADTRTMHQWARDKITQRIKEEFPSEKIEWIDGTS